MRRKILTLLCLFAILMQMPLMAYVGSIGPWSSVALGFHLAGFMGFTLTMIAVIAWINE